MKIKRLKSTALLGVILLGLFVNTISAQSYYVKPLIGYGFEANRAMYYNSNMNVDKGSYESGLYSLGSGIQIGLDMNARYKSGLALGLEVSHVTGTEFEQKGSYVRPYADHSDKFTYSDKYIASFFKWVPSISYYKPLKVLTPFIRLGVIFLSNVNVDLNEYKTVLESPHGYNGSLLQRFTYSGESAWGANMGLGVVKAFDWLELSAELNYDIVNWSPDKSEAYEMSSNGHDILSQAPTYFKETVYKDNANEDNSANANMNAPREYRRIQFPMSSFGVRVGLGININWLMYGKPIPIKNIVKPKLGSAVKGATSPK